MVSLARKGVEDPVEAEGKEGGRENALFLSFLGAHFSPFLFLFRGARGVGDKGALL